MSNQGNLIFFGKKFTPNTLSPAVGDIDRNRNLKYSLRELAEHHALGFPVFSPSETYNTGDNVFYDRRLWSFVSEHSGEWNASHVSEFSIKDYADAILSKIQEGEVVALLAENLASWEEDVSEVSNHWDNTIRSTAGDDPIDTAFGGILNEIIAKSDFKCDALRTSGYNLLHRNTNGGVATKISTGYYFPVPHLELGAFGDATKNNGVLLTARDGSNITSAIVRFKALEDGVPTSLSDGEVCDYEDVTYNDETFRTYLTSGPGWLIVSGITWEDTCAHLAWEDWYDKFVDPQDEDDYGDIISLSSIFAAAPNGTGKFLVAGDGGSAVATRAVRTGAQQMTITDPVARLTSPVWTNEIQEDEVTYKHSIVISGMKSGGVVEIEGSEQALTVEGTTVSYTDDQSTAISGAVRYELATPATAVVTIDKTQYTLNDCGVEMKEGAVGEAYFGCTYSQNVADALSQIAKVKLDSSLSVVAEALVKLSEEISGLSKLLSAAYGTNLSAAVVDALDYNRHGIPAKVEGAGAPSASVIPLNWPEGKPWTGAPIYPGMEYFDNVAKKWYDGPLTPSTSIGDWVAR